MKKLNVYSTVVNINGRKSSGCEDASGYQHWRLVGSDCDASRD